MVKVSTETIKLVLVFKWTLELIKLKGMKFKFILYILILFSSETFCQDFSRIIYSNDLEMGGEVKVSGKKLMSQENGFILIHNESSFNEETLIIGVHGRKSEGYEWIYGLKALSNEYKHTYFYRYNWNICPDSATIDLSDELTSLIGLTEGVEKIVVFGHSYGGVVVTALASKLHFNIPIEIHSIASPLRGYSSLQKRCEIQTKRDGSLDFKPWGKNIAHFQWRTHHKLDGAFRKMEEDPQQVNLFNSNVTLLPESMNGRRLGHNWSITWVVDEFLRIPHKL